MTSAIQGNSTPIHTNYQTESADTTQARKQEDTTTTSTPTTSTTDEATSGNSLALRILRQSNTQEDTTNTHQKSAESPLTSAFGLDELLNINFGDITSALANGSTLVGEASVYKDGVRVDHVAKHDTDGDGQWDLGLYAEDTDSNGKFDTFHIYKQGFLVMRDQMSS